MKWPKSKELETQTWDPDLKSPEPVFKKKKSKARHGVHMLASPVPCRSEDKRITGLGCQPSSRFTETFYLKGMQEKGEKQDSCVRFTTQKGPWWVPGQVGSMRETISHAERA